ncbi:MAG: Gfo/Idh/MocA family oxidoreductase [Pirellulaceae bacterium]|nr:Gfo/Idh/MocA family oxidoreductase [Pirellulaceae bacterium]
MVHRIDRRTFTKSGAAAAMGLATVAAAPRAVRAANALGANEKIRLGFIGVANRGGQLIDGFMAHDDMEIVAVCDVDQEVLARAKEKVGGRVETYTDFRKLIERNDVDAVVIATPDHWHAIQMIMACDAGKDVYVEKPLSITVVEGRRMVEAARRNNRVVQVGTHRRSSLLYSQLAQRATQGEFGKICVSTAYRLSNMAPEGIGRKMPAAPPSNLDWDMWLGPRPRRPFQENIAPYRFRWWDLYSSQMANWGVHFLDAIRWCTGELAPSAVTAVGGRYAVDDDRTIPDTALATFEFASGRLAIFGQYETSGNSPFPFGEIEMRGTKGTVYASERGYRVVPERGGQFQDRASRMEPEEFDQAGSNASLTEMHARNFLDCVRTREKPNADIETGHRSTTFALIANIALQMGQRLQWDAEQERFMNCDEANNLLHYEYRAPWKLG